LVSGEQTRQIEGLRASLQHVEWLHAHVLHSIAFANNTASVPARFLSIKWNLPDSIGVEISVGTNRWNKGGYSLHYIYWADLKIWFDHYCC
jgi:hypothetical protein